MQFMKLVLLASFFRVAAGFCDDGITIPTLSGNLDVVVTWAQAPLFSTSPQIGQKGKYLNMFHTALVFRQDTKYWTLEFDSVNKDLTQAIVPTVSGDELTWANDARWCLREGIFNGREHWTTHFTDVATISPKQFLQTIYDFIPRFNSTVPGAFPQYQFWRVQNVNGTVLIDDTTCGHSYRVLDYLRREQQVPLLKMEYAASRVKLPLLGSTQVDMSNSEEKAEVVQFYSTLQTLFRGKDKVDRFKALFEFLSPWKFVYDPLARKYYKINLGAPGEVVLLDFVVYEAIGDLQPPPGTTCDVTSACATAMAARATYGMGNACKDALGAVSDGLVAGGCDKDATARAADVNCFCGNQCYTESSACLAKMAEHCTRGGGDSCGSCLVWAWPQIALFGPCDASWGANAIISAAASRACFCAPGQWKPNTTEVLIA